MKRSMQEKARPERIAMLPTNDGCSLSETCAPPANNGQNPIFHICVTDVMDDSHVYTRPCDSQSPGDLSQGQFSLGVESTVSGQSDNSRTGLLGSDTTRNEGTHNNIIFEDDDEDEEDNECHIGRFRPQCFLLCENIQMFVCFMCALIVVASALTTGYLNSVITTIEKRFEIGSSVSGLIAAAYEFGNLVAVIFVSFLGASRHIPKWIGCGVLMMGIGSLLFSLPHIIAPKYSVRSRMAENNVTNDANICRRPGQHPDDGMCIQQNSGNWGYVLLLVAAQILIGTGGTPIMTLGITYVDNHVAKEASPAYLASMHASGALGPVLGYALGALLLQYYVDTFSHETQITSGNPRWIGAWWGGFVICGVLLLLLALPFLAYPRVLVKERRRLQETKTKEALLQNISDDVAEDKHYGRSLRDIPKAVLHLIKNPVYTVMLPAICCEICIVSGFVVFLPKYLESQFGTSTSLANLFTGGIGIPGAVVGILMGGYIMKRLALSPKGAIKFVLLLNTMALCGFSFFFYMGCDNVKIAGANFPYFNSTGHKIFEANLTSSCNQNCACSTTQIQPICGINGITYFSPCHAGCTGSKHFYDLSKEENSFNYSGCSCIRDGPAIYSNHEVIISPMATSGPCKNTCERLLPFLILLVFMTFCVAGTQMPLLMVTLRSVGTMERSFALGLQFVVMRLFAYIPSPIFFGNAIDSTCLLWSVKCQRNGSCLLYDIVMFRYKYVGIAAGLKVISLCFFIAVWYFISRRTLDPGTTNAGVEPQAAVSVNRDKADSKGRGLVLTGGHTPNYQPSRVSIRSPTAQGQGVPVGPDDKMQKFEGQDGCNIARKNPTEIGAADSNVGTPTNIPADESL